MRLAVLGGTFDPVHVGHLFLAEEVRIQLGYDRILLVPAHVAPHKGPRGAEDPGAPAGARLRMLEIATAEGALPGEQAVLGVDDCELERGGVSYTIQTMEEIVRDYRPSGRPGLIIGDDLVEGFGGWREPERLAEIADIVVARRALEATPSFPYRHLDVCNLRLPISSRLIRGRLRAGLPVRFLVPDAVLHYIESHGLYRPHSAQAAATPRPGHADAAGASSAHPWEPCP